MQATKRDLVRDYILRRAMDALKIKSVEMPNREHAEVIRMNVRDLAGAIAWHLCNQYEFLELADIFEWKRTRIRR